MNTKPQKQKIAVLGSGMSALASVYELTSYENWQDHYDITIYQMGWRIGGKTATGRGPKERIQEHGIHIAQGWYENAFRLIANSYEECEKEGLMPNSPFKTWKDAFEQENTTLLTHFDIKQQKWLKKNIIFPANDYTPGQGGPLPFPAIVKKIVGLILEIVFGRDPNKHMTAASSSTQMSDPFQDHEPGLWESLISKLGGKVKHDAEELLDKIVEHLQSIADEKDGETRAAKHGEISKMIETVSSWFRKLVDFLAGKSEYFYWLAVFAEFGIVALKGTLLDVYNPQTNELDYDNINGEDFRGWLKKNGASDRLLKSAMVRFLYTGTFHNLTGKNQNGLLAAGVGLHFLTLSMGYKGAFVWKFKAGTADTMITPIYLVLKNRGVKFKFFHKVEQVHYSDTGSIEQITMAEQVTLKNGEYNPTYPFKGIDVWPGEPLYDQIDDQQAQKLQEDHVDLEMAWTNWKNVQTFDMKKGEAFDYVILGIPIDVLGGDQGICKEIIANNTAWNQMYSHVKSIPTMSMQLWLKPNLKQLGMDLQEWGFPEGSRPNLVTYLSPQYSWIDMSQVMPFENWENDEPGVLVYYTGSFLDPAVVPPFSDVKYPSQQLNRVQRISEQWLRDNMGWFFPNSSTIEYPRGMNLQDIYDFSEGAPTDFSLLKTQYFRANVNPTDRYTLSLPGTNQYRLKVDESGFNNLILTGDWTNFGVNVGYYEGAIISGLQAGQAIRTKLGLESENAIFSGVKMK